MANKEHVKLLQASVEEWNTFRQNHPEISPDFSNADMSNLSLSKANLKNSNFQKTNLTGTNLIGCLLDGANFAGADLTKADLRNIELGKKVISDSEVSRFSFYDVRLVEANLSKSDMSNIDFTKSDLRRTNFSGSNLKYSIFFEANLTETNFENAKMNWAKLGNSNLSHSILIGTNLRGANFYKAIISGANIDKSTKISGSLFLTKGLNGIYNNGTDTAALFTLKPKGNSMQGENPDAISKMLMGARKLHGFSLILSSIAFIIKIPELQNIIQELKTPVGSIIISPETYIILALTLSCIMMIIVRLYFYKALDGTQFLSDRNSAMSVGSFPWVMSIYSGDKIINKVQSLIIRFILAFHPIVYVLFLSEIKYFPNNLKIYCFIVFSVLLFYCTWIFIISQYFQRPILFESNSVKTNLKISNS